MHCQYIIKGWCVYKRCQYKDICLQKLTHSLAIGPKRRFSLSIITEQQKMLFIIFTTTQNDTTLLISRQPALLNHFKVVDLISIRFFTVFLNLIMQLTNFHASSSKCYLLEMRSLLCFSTFCWSLATSPMLIMTSTLLQATWKNHSCKEKSI